ncbi:MAG: class I SAM-dependent methyltransferase [Roseburia sp.]
MKDSTNKNFWQKFAKIYTKFMTKNDNAYAMICDNLGKYINSQKKVLELACGTGQVTFQMADKSAFWIATDYSENMIKEAEKRKTSKNMEDKVIFQVQDATALTYEKESFDVVVIANALHIMPNPDVALEEIHRVLKKNGILFAPTFVYEKGYSKLLIRIMEKAGFKTYHKWIQKDYNEYISRKGFKVIDSTLVNGKPLSECILCAQKVTTNNN